jgi:hypothetical protein
MPLGDMSAARESRSLAQRIVSLMGQVLYAPISELFVLGKESKN